MKIQAVKSCFVKLCWIAYCHSFSKPFYLAFSFEKKSWFTNRLYFKCKHFYCRLQAELEEARKQAQEEMFQELEKAKREAELEWNSRKTGYEDKLVELEQSRQEAQEFIQKLQKQKMVSVCIPSKN